MTTDARSTSRGSVPICVTAASRVPARSSSAATGSATASLSIASRSASTSARHGSGGASFEPIRAECPAASTTSVAPSCGVWIATSLASPSPSAAARNASSRPAVSRPANRPTRAPATVRRAVYDPSSSTIRCSSSAGGRPPERP